ncbi:hypothetical protein ABGB12_23195 [Actinocorallia sp. B10E7]|uniref:hypothetical protein n=1 Tax=Actinocorallia sp. B10E7 TaxID=3153558 RepID=UPI00325DDF9C
MSDERKALDPKIAYAPLNGMTDEQEAAFHEGLMDEYRACADAVEAGELPVRNNVQTLRLSDGEADLLRAAAEKVGMPLSVFIRQAALQAATAKASEVVWTIDHDAFGRLAQNLAVAAETLQEAVEEVRRPREHRLVTPMRLDRTA